MRYYFHNNPETLSEKEFIEQREQLYFVLERTGQMKTK